MKSLFFTVILTVVMLFSCKSQKGFTITGVIEGANDKTVVLSVYNKEGVNVLDTLDVVDGKVNYSTSLKEPVMLLIGEAGSRNTVNLFADNVPYTINGSLDNVAEVTITGGEVYNTYNDIGEKIKEQNTASNELRSAYAEAEKAGDVKKQKEIVAEFENGQKKIEEIQMEAVKNNPASPVSAFIVSNVYSNKSLDEMKEGLAMLDASVSSSTYYQILDERIKKLEHVAIGQAAPDFTMNDTEGNPVSLSSFRGKYLLIDFWASWCSPCRRENPNVVKLYDEYKDKGFDILGVSLDQKKDAWLKAIEDDKLTWNHVSDLKGWGNEAANLYGVTGIPHTVLLDKEGKIIAKNLRGDALRDKVSELIK